MVGLGFIWNGSGLPHFPLGSDDKLMSKAVCVCVYVMIFPAECVWFILAQVLLPFPG